MKKIRATAGREKRENKKKKSGLEQLSKRNHREEINSPRHRSEHKRCNKEHISVLGKEEAIFPNLFAEQRRRGQ
jgi:hypothetical protein